MDERVAMAISRWGPRFTTNGVTAGARMVGPFCFADRWDRRPVLTQEAFRVRPRSPDMARAREVAGQLGARTRRQAAA